MEIIGGTDPGEVLEALRAVDWEAFDLDRDLPPLRAALTGLERARGVTEAHRFATEKIRERGAPLRHPDSHGVEVHAHSLSPDGAHLALGSWVGDDVSGDGVVQIWEVAAGRCVNVLPSIEGGVGFPTQQRSIQWSADGTRIAIEHNYNVAGMWDPFGEPASVPYADAPGEGARGSAFALAPDGLRVFVRSDDGHTILGRIAPLLDEARGDEAGDVEIPNWDGTWAEELDEEEPDEDGDGDDDEQWWGGFHRVFWSRDGARIHGDDDEGWTASIDVATGRPVWTIMTRDSSRLAAAWSADERLFAYQRDGRLVIADALTGAARADRAEIPDADFLCWGPTGDLAVVVAADWRGPGAVTVLDAAGEHRYDLDVAPRPMHYDDQEDASWAWAPDGAHAAVLTAGGRIEVWSLGARPERLREFDVPAGTRAVRWAGGGVLIAVGPRTLRFVRAATGETVADHTFLRVPPGPRPLVLDGEDFGEDMDPEPDPTFALDDATWAVAFESGPVIAPAGRAADLDEVLAWAAGRRFAWPVRWGGLDVVPDAPAAAERVGPPLAEYLEPFRGRSGPPTAEPEWPPPNTPTVDDLFREAGDLIGALDDTGGPHKAAALQELALLHARRGDAGRAAGLAAVCPEEQRPRIAAVVAAALVAAGRPEDARRVFTVSDAGIENARTDPAAFAAAMGAACALLGDAGLADRWFGRAREWLDDWPDRWDERMAVVRALIDCGREDEARARLAAGQGKPTAGFDAVPLLGYLLRTGRTALAEEFLRTRAGWLDDSGTNALLVAAGRPDLLREWKRGGDRYVGDDEIREAERIAAEGLPTGPSEADMAAMAEAHREILRTPEGSRARGTYDLLRTAARRHHLGAVLDLLPELRMPFGGGGMSSERPWAALGVVRVVVTGADVAVW